MSGFFFDAKASLEAARKGRTLPNRPDRPSPSTVEGTGLGGLGGLETMCASDPRITPKKLVRDIYEERAAIPEFCGGQDRNEAERVVRQEAWQAAGLTSLDDWRREAVDLSNPDNWR